MTKGSIILNALNLISAALVGVTVGLAGHACIRTWRSVPRVLPVVIGATAAVSGTIAAWFADHGTGSLTPTGLARQALFAGIAIAVVAAKVNQTQRGHGRTPE